MLKQRAKQIAFLCLFFSGLLVNAQEKIKVVVTASMLTDMAQNIGGDKIDVKCIVPIGGDPHIYEPVPTDARLVANAQLIFRNGLTFEGWLNKLMENSGTKAPIITVTKGIDVISSQTYTNSADPHAWMNSNNVITYVKNMKNALIQLDPENEQYYTNNYNRYKKELETLHDFVIEEIKKIPADKRIIITSHDAFQYYGRAYGLQLEAVLGTSTDAVPQTSDYQRLTTVIKASKVPAIFVESTINPKTLRQIAKDNGVKIGGQLYADSLGDEDSPAPTYVKMMMHNTTTIVNGLSGIISESTATNDVHNNHEEQELSKGKTWMVIGVLAFLFLGGFLFVAKKLNG